MGMDFNSFQVRLIKHIGKKRVDGLGMIDVEHDQKFVVLWPNDTPKPMELGILPDREGAPLLWNPDQRQIIGEAKGFVEWVEQAAQAEKRAGRSYFTWQESNPYTVEANSDNSGEVTSG